eukprot:gene4372-5985_t
MKFFVDTADIKDIKELNDMGLIDGVTTNPSLILKSGRKILEVTKEICDIVEGPVSSEVAATDYETMMKEAAVISKIAPNICIKLPLTLDGLKACKALTSDGHKTNVTLCFSAVQALLAAGLEIHCLRDLTRGGLATSLVEMAEAAKLCIGLDETKVPVTELVRGA